MPEQLRGKMFRGTTAVRSGLLTPNQLRGPAWRRLFPDASVHADVPVTHVLRPETTAPGTTKQAAARARSTWVTGTSAWT